MIILEKTIRDKYYCFSMKVQSLLNYFWLFSLLACQQPLEKTYVPSSFTQDIENIRLQSQEEADQIIEQVEFGDYAGSTYQKILIDFEDRMLRVEENLVFIDQMKALKDSLIINVDWLRATDLTLVIRDDKLIGEFNLYNLHPRSLSKIIAEVSFKNQYPSDENNCYYLVFEIDSEKQAIKKTKKRIRFNGLAGFPGSCPLNSLNYGEANIHIHEVEFTNGEHYSSEDFKTRIAYRYRSIRKSLTPVLLVALWTKNKQWNEEQQAQSYPQKLMFAKDHIEYREKYEYAIP